MTHLALPDQAGLPPDAKHEAVASGLLQRRDLFWMGVLKEIPLTVGAPFWTPNLIHTQTPVFTVRSFIKW